jgi:MscS family membrane protein
LPHWAPSVLLPAFILVAACCSKWFIDVLNFIGPVQRVLDTAFEVLIYLVVTWLVVVCFNALSDWVAALWGSQRRSFDSGVLRVSVRVIGMLLAAGMLAFGASQIGVPLVGILAGLGFGGLAVALAAQPTMENLIGGIMIYADRPVRVGDHCKFGDQTGVIEEIGIRSTRVRAPDRSITSIPNGEFSKLRLTNYSQRDRVLFNTTLGLNYDAKGEQLHNILQGLRELLASHPKIQPQSAKVNLSAFAATGMEIELSAELNAPHPTQLTEIREDLLLRIFGIVEAQGAKMVGR